MRNLLLFLLTLLFLQSFSQRKYYCVYRDSTFPSLGMNDKISQLLSEGLSLYLKTTGLPDSEIQKTTKAIISEGSIKPAYSVQERKVKARNEFTVIVFDRFTKEGNLKIEDQPDSILLQNDEIYIDASTKNGFSTTPIDIHKKSFQLTSLTRKILNYLCKEYLSTDSTCRIWITENLPSSINPGIRVGAIKGAVLAFEEKNKQFFVKSEVIEIKFK